MYSAVQVDGQRMYRAARDGKVIKRDPRPVSVFKFKVWRDSPNSPLVDYWIECSKGTYIRSLIHDLVRNHPPIIVFSAKRMNCDKFAPFLQSIFPVQLGFTLEHFKCYRSFLQASV
jgi:tRNA pseudouridine(55) synthase